MTMQTHEEQVIALLKQLIDAVIEPPRRPKTSADAQMIVRTVIADSLTVPVQGPDIPVVKGFSVTVRQRQHVGTPTGGIGFTRNGVANAATRIQLQDGESITVWVNNFNQLWFLADTVDTGFEIIGVC